MTATTAPLLSLSFPVWFPPSMVRVCVRVCVCVWCVCVCVFGCMVGCDYVHYVVCVCEYTP